MNICSFDRTLGGLEMQLRLRDHLGKKFNEQKKTNKNVFDNARSVAKLFKEAGRLKLILSANQEYYAQVTKFYINLQHFWNCGNLSRKRTCGTS